MINLKHKYHGSDLAIIIPTKDRPEKVKNLLSSISKQTLLCGRIIIVDSGMDIENIVDAFINYLPVEYYRTSVQGQIYQRNFGISLLDEKTKLVCSLDDDIVFESETIASMISFWNDCESETAGVSFNIVNNPPFKHTLLKAFIGMSAPQQGRVLASGYNVTISPVDKNIRTQWLCGGATIWKKEILDKFVNKEVSAKWAVCEDVIFSYPIGKKYPLYVCADAKVRHEHAFDYKVKMKYRYIGKTATLWRLHFVESNPELSKLLFFWMVSWEIMIRLLRGIFLLRPQEIQYAFGQMEAAIQALIAKFIGKELLNLLNDS
jgi:glycosyltransferase involved in cell wall biosynthesis